ncbi:hypothetical protein LSTR_LSTR012826, partial [Laodelphax striatellus]
SSRETRFSCVTIRANALRSHGSRSPGQCTRDSTRVWTDDAATPLQRRRRLENNCSLLVTTIFTPVFVPQITWIVFLVAEFGPEVVARHEVDG